MEIAGRVEAITFGRVQANVIREEREDGILLPILGRTWSRTFRVQFQL